MSKAGVLAFTAAHGGIVRVIKTPLWVGKIDSAERHEFVAIWDTGATESVISEKVIETVGLLPFGIARVAHVQGISETPQFMCDFVLLNQVTVRNVIVTKVNLFGADALIGMDVISLGDFAVTNHQGKTVFSFRTPSVESIDFVRMETTIAPPKYGRNAPCPCGSGKKFKNCCIGKLDT